MKNEQQTRIELIDKMLLQAGWDVNDPAQVQEEFDILVGLPEGVQEPRTPYEGHQFSDYVLLGKDGKPLAVVEAKKTSRDAAIGREQAKQYCFNIQKQLGIETPFCFYSNGIETFFWDIDNYPPRKVIGFPTRDDLERFQYIRRNRKPLTQELINTSIAGRDYQIRAIRSVLEAIEQKKRDFLLVMATGTGKTRTCIALIGALMRGGHAEKILFLVDRIALRDQARSAFKEHLPNEPHWPNTAEKVFAKDRRIYIATYPTMLNIIRDESNAISPWFFDFIVIDESHRSIYNCLPGVHVIQSLVSVPCVRISPLNNLKSTIRRQLSRLATNLQPISNFSPRMVPITMQATCWQTRTATRCRLPNTQVQTGSICLRARIMASVAWLKPASRYSTDWRESRTVSSTK